MKNWMFANVYKVDTVDETPRVRTVIMALFECFMARPQLMNIPIPEDLSQPALARLVCDFVAGMTDRFASQMYAQLFMPSSWRGV